MSMSNGRLISADSHVMEPIDLWEKTLFDSFGDDTPRVLDGYLGKEGMFFHTGGQVMEYGGSDRDSQKIGMQAAGWDPAVRVEFQEKAGVVAEILNATFMLLIMRHPNYDCLRACARVFNDWLAEFIAHDRKRLYGVGMIPTDDVDWAIEELERCAKNGFSCVNIHLYSPPGSPPYRKPIYDPFWARAAEMDIPIQLHIITGRVPDPIHFYTPEEQALSPQTQLAMFYEVMGVLVNEFIFGKILDRHPKLRVVCSEFENFVDPQLHVAPRSYAGCDVASPGFAQARHAGQRLHAPAHLARNDRRYLRDRDYRVSWYGPRPVGIGFPPYPLDRFRGA